MRNGDTWFRRRRLAGRLGVVGVSRLLVFQLIQVGLFVVVVRGPWAAVGGSLVGVLAIAAVFGRWRGRWLTEIAGLWLRHRRRRGVVANQSADFRLAALGELVPDLVVEDVPGPDDGKLGMGSDGAGWFAVVEAEPADAGVEPPVPMAALGRIAADAGIAGVAVQVVSLVLPQPQPQPPQPPHQPPLPPSQLPHQPPQPQSQPLPPHQPPPQPAPRQRRLWVAVRLDADLVAEAVVGDPEPPVDVPAVLSELVRRTKRALKRRGLGSRILDRDALLDALALSCDLGAAEAGGYQVPRVREDWRAWHSQRLSHRCYWVHTWPDPDRGTLLLAGLADLPEVRVSVSLTLEPRQETADTDLRCLVRLAAPAPRLPLACERAERLALGLGGRLFALDGEHAPAVYSSAPSGGGAR